MTEYRGKIASFVCGEFDTRMDKRKDADYINEDYAFAEFTLDIYGEIIKAIVDDGKSPDDALKFSKKYLDELFDRCVECTKD